ncbi:MAG: DUF4397 domain-containing protein [Nocardioidaceae bacterium]
MFKVVGPAAAAAIALLAMGPAHAGQASAPATAPKAASAKVFVLQGVPQSTVDVTIDGKSVRQSAAPKSIIGPLDLSRGDHTVAFKASDWEITSDFTITGASTDVVVHWPADKAEKPVVTVFSNDTSPVAAQKGRLSVAHTAVVPPADVRVDEKVLFSNIANGEFVSADVPSGAYSVDIVPTGQDGNLLFGPVNLPVRKGLLTRVFAIGEPTNNSMDAIVQTLPLHQSGTRAPDLIDAGSAGLASTPASLAGGAEISSEAKWPFALTAIVATLLAVGLMTRRRVVFGSG